MKHKQVKELRDKSVEALKQDMDAMLKQIFTLRTQSVTQKLENPKQITSVRHDIARIKTILRQRQLAKK